MDSSKNQYKLRVSSSKSCPKSIELELGFYTNEIDQDVFNSNPTFIDGLAIGDLGDYSYECILHRRKANQFATGLMRIIRDHE